MIALLALPALALARTYSVGAGLVRGQPTIEDGKILGYFIWVDKAGFHLRWCTDGKPYLFTGRIDADKPIKEIKDVREEPGGWAKIYGNRIVMFSKTSRGQVDGLDLTIPQGRIVQIDPKVILHADAIAAAREVALGLFRKANSFTTMEFRDALGVSRKYAVPILDYFDSVRLTARHGNRRTPGAAAKELLS